MIEVSSLTLVPKTILYRRRERCEFTEAGEHEWLEEMQEFIRCLKNKTVFLSGHISVLFRAKANLPEDKETLIEGIQKVMDKLPEERMRTHRQMAANYF